MGSFEEGFSVGITDNIQRKEILSQRRLKKKTTLTPNLKRKKKKKKNRSNEIRTGVCVCVCEAEDCVSRSWDSDLNL